MPHGPELFDTWKRLLTLERDAERARFAEEEKRLTLEEREQKGLCVLDLEMKEEFTGLGGRHLVTFERADKKRMRVPPEPGDLAALRPRRSPEQAPARGIVSRSTGTRVTVAFDKPPPPFIFEGRLVLDRIPNDVTFERTVTAVDTVRSWDQGVLRTRREVLLGNTPPRFDKPVPLAPDAKLNAGQRDAAERALGAQDFFLVHGPPGTGKSTVLAQVAVESVRRGERVLCTAASNAAVDHLAELCLSRGLRTLRIGHPARVSGALQEHTLDLVVEENPDRKLSRELFDEAFDLLGYARRQRTQGRSRERFHNARESQAEARQLMDEARKLERKAVRTELDRADVLCATLAALPGHVLSGESFDVALVDEATQAVEPLTLIAFLKAPRIVLAGDHQQLPPTVISQDAQKQGLGVSLFERLLKEHGDGVKKMLTEQYRMSEALMTFPSHEMYGDGLTAHPSVAGRTLADVLPQSSTGLDAPPFLFLDTAGKGFDEEREAKGESFLNPGEADLVLARVKELLAAGVPGRELAVIAPYRGQVSLLRERLEAAPGNATGIEVDTVDAFQGREKDVVLVTLTRSNAEGQVGFLSELRRTNVAITRARRHLFVVGDSATLSNHAYYARLIERAQALGGYRSAWEWASAEVTS